MSVAGYPSYKESGVEWLAAVPSHWKLEKFRHHFRESFEKIEAEVVGPMLSVSGYRGIEIKAYNDENRRRTNEDLIGYRIVRKGQLVVNTMWLNYAGLGVSDYEGHVSPAYRSYWASQALDLRFAHYLLRSSAYVMGYTQLITGVRPNSLQMSRDDLMSFPLVLPPLSEQASITAFLVRETAKIDALVEEQRRLIVLLREKRQAVISHVVTKGLDPSAPMKDSGVEWLGDVPNHWQAVQLGRICTQVSDGPHFSPNYVDEGILFLSARNVRSDGWWLDDVKYISEFDYNEFCKRVLPQPGDVLYTKGGTTGIAKVVDLKQRFQVWVHVAVLKIATSKAKSEYVAYALNSIGCYEQSQLHTRGATNQDLGLTRLIKIWLALPPLAEQQGIIDVLDEITTGIDQLVLGAESAIALMQERRAALISAAVTGKIDVRDFAPAEAEAA